MRKLRLTALFLLAALLLAACATTATGKATTVIATLSDNMMPGMTGSAGGMISLDRARVPAGAVTFAVKNGGLLQHELVVIKTDVAQDKLSADAAEPGKMDEAGSVGETGDMNAGALKTFSITLSAGHYVLMCNELGHYAGGMHMAFTVD